MKPLFALIDFSRVGSENQTFEALNGKRYVFFRDWILQDNSSSFVFGANFSNDLIPMFVFLVFPSILWFFYIFFLSSWAWGILIIWKVERSPLKQGKRHLFFYKKAN